MNDSTPTEASAPVRERVCRAREVQGKRFLGSGIHNNAQMTPSHLREYCKLDSASQALLQSAMEKFGLSARAYDRILKVSRTLADLDGAVELEPRHVAEAIQYRNLDRSAWRS